MLEKGSATLEKARSKLKTSLFRPAFLALLPALCLALFYGVGEMGLVAAAILFPLLYALSGVKNAPANKAVSRSAVLSKMHRDSFHAIVHDYFQEARENGMKSATFQIEIDDFSKIVAHYGQSAADTIAEVTGDRLLAVIRGADAVTQSGACHYLLCLAPTRQLDLELCIQLAGRMQTALEQPISIGGTSVYVTGCIGFCQLKSHVSRSSETWLQAAGHALHEAKHHGPSAIRAYSSEIHRRSETQAELAEEIADALDSGAIQAWFQPQISTDTGLVTGFEALARWNHPTRGMVQPNIFLPAIEQAGMLERLAEVMMSHALTALKAWDSAGLNIPQVGVNFAGPELSNPKLVEKVKWELDRFDLAPQRLGVEVLETVVAGTSDDTITRNINALSKLGCRIDLDDFGTGTASIASIRRFAVGRIKIDRSFVIKADVDPEQQRMIGAILTMAERLGIETLAEGVETVGEHALLAQLGCDHVQGFGIGKPMPFEQTIDWIRTHTAKLQAAPEILGKKYR